MSDSFGETWEKFVNGQADYRELILAGHEKSFRFAPNAVVGGIWLFDATGAWGADALRIIANELDRRNSRDEISSTPA